MWYELELAFRPRRLIGAAPHVTYNRAKKYTLGTFFVPWQGYPIRTGHGAELPDHPSIATHFVEMAKNPSSPFPFGQLPHFQAASARSNRWRVVERWEHSDDAGKKRGQASSSSVSRPVLNGIRLRHSCAPQRQARACRPAFSAVSTRPCLALRRASRCWLLSECHSGLSSFLSISFSRGRLRMPPT